MNPIKKYLAKIGAKGGKSTSEKKAEAARLNGAKGGRKRLNLNSLRLLFAASVIFGHSPELINGEPSRELFHLLGINVTIGHVAVRGFFILSGFLIAGSWFNQPNVFSFLRKRVLRIYPAFIVCSVICLTVGVMAGGSINPMKSVVAMLTLTQPSSSGAFAGTYFPSLNGSMWTIIFEFACYVMIAALGMSGALRGLKSALAVFAVSLVLSFVSIPDHGLGYYAGMFFSLAPWFLFGAIFHFRQDWLSWIRLPSLKIDISYGLYLYGWPAQKCLLWACLQMNQVQLSITALGVAACLGYISFRVIEEPCLKLKYATFPKLNNWWAWYKNSISTPLTNEQREINFHVGF